MTGSTPTVRSSEHTDDPRRSKRLDGVVLLALMTVGTLISLVRVPRQHLDVVWAEDANIFLFEAVNHGSIDVLFHGYAGYQHLIPRIVAGVILAVFPLEWYAIAVFACCALLTSLCAFAVYMLSRDLVTWWPARIALALVTILLPLAGQEVLGNLADIHSYCMWLMPWLLLYRPRSWKTSVFLAVIAFLCIMTEVQAVIFLALIPFRLRTRFRMSWPLLGALVVGAAWQLATTVLSPRPSTTQWYGLWAVVKGWLVNSVLPLITPAPDRQLALLNSTGVLIPALLALVLGIAAGYLLWRGGGEQRLLTVTLLLASAAIYGGGAVADGSPVFNYSAPSDEWIWLLNSRYGVSSGLMLAGVVPLWASVWVERRAAVGSSRGPALVAGLTLLSMILMFVFGSTQAYSSRVAESWSTSVSGAELECEGVPGDSTVPLPVAPGGRIVSLSCDRILELAG